jgi:hypothetical protein
MSALGRLSGRPSLPGLADQLFQLPLQQGSAPYDVPIVPLTIELLFYIGKCRLSGSSQLKSAFKR